MAVIITDMDKPKCCSECKEKFLDRGINITCGVFYKDCPLKSADKMIEEIEETYINNCDFNYQIAIDIIHKYCNKENEDGKTD